MKREYDLRRRLHSLQTLGEAVTAMKSLSAQHFREVRGAIEPARAYREGVSRLLEWTGAALPAGPGRAGLLVIGGEFGLCGSYNARLVLAAAKRREELGPGPVLCVGHRAGVLLRRRKVEVRRVYEAPASARSIPKLLLRLAEEVLTTFGREGLSSFDVVSSRFAGVGADVPESARILPLSAAKGGEAPAIRYVSRERLASAAAREFLYVTLYDLLLDALASEHGARLVATQSAEDWLEERTSMLRRYLAATRREASTQEVIEISAARRARLPRS